MATLLAFLRRRMVQALLAASVSALLVLLAVAQVGALDLADARANDFLLATAAPSVPAPDPNVTLVTITESVLATLPYRSPVDRSFLAALVDRLGAAGVRAIGFDILFDQATEPDKDAALVDAIRRQGGRVAVAWGDHRAGLIEQQSAWLAGFVTASGARPGFADLVLDADGVVRRFATRRAGTDLASLPAALAALAGVDPGARSGLIGWRRPADAAAQAFATLPANAVLNLPPPVLQRVLKDRIVLVGADLPQSDRHRTGLSTAGMDSGGPLTAGVAVQAHILSQLVEGRSVSVRDGAEYLLILFALALAGAVLAGAEVPLLVRVGGLALALLGLAYLAYASAAAGLPLVPLVSPALALVVSFMVASGLANWTTGRDKRLIRTAFSQYLAPALVAEIASDPGKLRLGGERREMSFIFSDIAGFTSLSEQLAPERLTSLLNDYLDGMSEIVLKHGGTIDKFIGDAVVAMFGAPARQADHAARALACAIDMDAFCERFRADSGDVALGITRIGVHSGDAIVGNFGGRRRFDYTAMGDTMNIAARLESANKHFGTRLAVSGDVLDRMTADAQGMPRLEGVEIVPVGNVLLKGKDRPVRIFTCRPSGNDGFAEDYRAAMRVLDGDAGEAGELFAALERRAPDDPLVRLHLGRIRAGERGITFRLNEK